MPFRLEREAGFEPACPDLQSGATEGWLSTGPLRNLKPYDSTPTKKKRALRVGLECRPGADFIGTGSAYHNQTMRQCPTNT